MDRMQHFPSFSIVYGDIDVKLDLSRFEKQYKKAQYELDGNVMNSMIPFMPSVENTFIDATRAASAAVQGTGRVYAAFGQSGRFLYMGKTMVDENTGSAWAKKGNKKVLVSQYGGKTNVKENLSYTHTHHPEAQSRWFEPAKKADGKSWIRQVKATAGGGKRGG